MTDSVKEDEELEIDDTEEGREDEIDADAEIGTKADDGGFEDEADGSDDETDYDEPLGGVDDAGGPGRARGATATTAEDAVSGDTELVALREEFESLNDRHLRLAAEFNNFRRRSEQERLNAWSRAQADLVEKFLDVLDDLHRVAELDLSNATVETIMEGIDLVERKFVRMLGDAGVEMIDPVGESFDPETMEAMMRVPVESAEQADTVAQVFQKGYSLKGVLIRPARVSVYTQG